MAFWESLEPFLPSYVVKGYRFWRGNNVEYVMVFFDMVFATALDYFHIYFSILEWFGDNEKNVRKALLRRETL